MERAMKKIHPERHIREKRRLKGLFTRGTKQHFHPESLHLIPLIARLLLKVTGLKKRGMANAADLWLNETTVEVANLPAGFDGYRMLLIYDMHIDGVDDITDKIRNFENCADYDCCILGGDYTFKYHIKDTPVENHLKSIAEMLVAKTPVYGILGNHDEYYAAAILNDCGVNMLINENICLERNGDKLYLVGIDDCHYFAAAEIAEASEGIETSACKIILSHSPELYKEAASSGFSLYLTGHTHGGQICLPGSMHILVATPVPRAMVKGPWRYKTMAGYTSAGVGSSGIPVRFFCPPEIALITLKAKSP